LGESLPGVAGIHKEGHHVAEGPTANIQIGVEVKVLSTAMIKQIDRVISDLRNQANQFKRRSARAISVAIVGVNHAAEYTSYEGDRVFVAKGSRGKEAPKAMKRLEDEVSSDFDEFVFLSFDAKNSAPFPFSWVDLTRTERLYGAAAVRLLRIYEERFG
jgi:hypothetical protein